MADLKQIGNMLAGFSAGSQGQLPAFIQSQQNQQLIDQQQQERQQISAEERMNTYFTDAAIGLDLINQGNIDGFLQLGAQRLQLLQNFPDADPSDTQILMQLGAAAKNGSREALEHLKGELQTAVQIGKGRGVIKTPQAEIIPASSMVNGQITQRMPDGSFQSQTPQGFQKAPDVQVNKDLLQVVDGGGVVTPIQYDPRGGGFLDMRGQPFNLPAGSTVTRVGAPTGAMADVIPATKEIQIRETEGAIRSFNDTAGRVIDLVRSNPDINTATARLGAFGSGALQEAGAMARFLGVPKETFDPAQYSPVFKQMGIENAAIQSLITSLAFQAAAASGQSGRDISNRDVERFISQIGGSYSDPAAFLRSLEETVTGVNRDFANRYEAVYRKPYEGNLGVPQFQPPSSDGWEIIP